MFSSLTVDNIAFNQSVDLIIKSGQIKKCKIITGYNSDEFGIFLLLTGIINENNNYGYKGFKFNEFLKTFNQILYYYPNYPSRRSSNVDTEIVNAYFKIYQIPGNLFSPAYLNYLNQMLSDFVFVCPSFQAAEIYSSLDLVAYVYEFKYRGAVSLLGNLTFLGTATHADELMYVFGLALSNKV
jgi:carboxylesterase type B